MKIHLMDLWFSCLNVFTHIGGFVTALFDDADDDDYSEDYLRVASIESSQMHESALNSCDFCTIRFSNLFRQWFFLWHLSRYLDLFYYNNLSQRVMRFRMHKYMPNLKFKHFFVLLNGRKKKTEWTKTCVTVLALLRRSSSRNTVCCWLWWAVSEVIQL